MTYAYGAAGSNNGQIRCITDNVDSGRNTTYSYDALYRISTAATTGSTNYPQWGLSWAYDQYGNRLNQTQTFGGPPTNSLSFANPGGAQTNRPDNMCFDANGNLMTETSVSPCPPSNPTYTYDAENRLVNYMGSSATYTFDGNGLRVKKAASGTTTVYIFSGSKVIAEYDNGAAVGSPSREYIYSGGALLAKIESGASIYYHPDHLSNRVLTDSSGYSLGQRGHYPFGETWYESGTTTKLQFTTYERDNESTNDYALARTYINRFGRFPSTDPIAGSLGDPQSLNRYTYGRNVPVSVIDPSGMKTDCTILQKRDTTNSQEVAGGPMADAGGSDPSEAEAQQGWGCGSSTSGGFPLGGGDILDLLMAWANGDIGFGFPSWNGERWTLPADIGALAALIGLGDPGGGGGGNYIEPYKNVGNCVKSTYGVDPRVFVPAAPGQNGNFIGRDSSGKVFSVETDVASYSTRTLSLKALNFIGALIPSLGTAGLTEASNPNLNYVANDLSPVELFPETQIHELGHSLDLITKGSTNEPSADRFADCVRTGKP